MRDILAEPSKYITQGTIFNNAKANHYNDNVYGLFISARCDIANFHFSSINYLPIISIKEWCESHLFDILIKRNIKNAYNEIEKKFKEKNLSSDALKYVDQEKLLTKHFNKKEVNDINKQITFIEISEKKVKKFIKDDISFLMNNYNSGANKLLMELIENKLQGYFYIENVDFYEQQSNRCNHFVILLQEVHSLPIEVAHNLANGIECKNINPNLSYFNKPDDTFTISEIKSPYIECIIQMFSSMYRIGIDRGKYLDINNVLFGESNEA